jgi:hypothetical protein
MIKKDDVLKWVEQQCLMHLDKSFETMHFDLPYTVGEKKERALTKLKYACSILQETKKVLLQGPNFSDQFKPLVYIPLGISENIKFWDDSLWNIVGDDFEPPSLYINRNREIMGLYVEEYKCPVDLPFECEYPIQPIYRCFRYYKYLDFDWEFSIGIYMYIKGDF